jgi:hypothetical protein
MSEPWFQLPGVPAVSQIVTVLTQVGGLFILFMIILMVIKYYIPADSVAVNAIRRFVGLGVGVPFAACMTRVFENHFFVPSIQSETMLFLIFVALCAAISAFVNQFPQKDTPNDHSNTKSN